MLTLLAFAAFAQSGPPIDPRCAGIRKPGDYDDQVQQDFLANYFALAVTNSPLHGPIPHQAGHGAIGIDLLVIPPLGCAKRFVLAHTKTEHTNKSPIAPRPNISFALDGPGPLVLYGAFAYLPPVTLLGTRNVLVSGEFGIGAPVGEKLELGGRFHATMFKSIADIAGAFSPTDPVTLDFYNASTFGLDLMGGVKLGTITPYLALGVTDASTFFYVGDDGFVASPRHPYFGPVASLGADLLLKDRFRLGAELYAAPGGYSRPKEPHPPATTGGFADYGHLYTGRVRGAIEF